MPDEEFKNKGKVWGHLVPEKSRRDRHGHGVRGRTGKCGGKPSDTAAPASAGRRTANEGERVYLRDRKNSTAIFLGP